MDLLRHKPNAQLAVGLMLAGVWLGYALHVSLGLGGSPLERVETPIYDGLLVAAALVCLLRVARQRQDRAAWSLIGAGLAVWSASDIYFNAAYGNSSNPPLPTLADAGWLFFYPASYVALLLLVRSRATRLSRSVCLDGLVGSLSVAALGAVVLKPIIDAGSGSTAAIATNLLY